MPEILTESFCERCGTRYTFESAAPTKTRKLAGSLSERSTSTSAFTMRKKSSLLTATARPHRKSQPGV